MPRVIQASEEESSARIRQGTGSQYGWRTYRTEAWWVLQIHHPQNTLPQPVTGTLQSSAVRRVPNFSHTQNRSAVCPIALSRSQFIFRCSPIPYRASNVSLCVKDTCLLYLSLNSPLVYLWSYFKCVKHKRIYILTSNCFPIIRIKVLCAPVFIHSVTQQNTDTSALEADEIKSGTCKHTEHSRFPLALIFHYQLTDQKPAVTDDRLMSTLE